MDDKEEELNKGRRTFLKAMIVLSAGAAVAGVLKGAVTNIITPLVGISAFPTMELVGADGKPLLYSDIPVNTPTTWLFYYPLTNDPNFLLNLGDASGNPVNVPPYEVPIPATGSTYKFNGGVGPKGSVVAYSAICQHLGCIPPEIHYYPPTQTVPGTSFSGSSNPGYIHCSCHGSTYDPLKGAAVITGPTSRPLPNVMLKYNSSKGTFSAYSMVGPTIYGKISDLSGGTPYASSATTVTVTNTGIP
ncbi:MAG: Rieske 2Fe-2S domain-containing protein [Thermoplasmata archaeon]